MRQLLATALLLVSSASAADPGDVLVADFESENYGDWKVEGTAFGNGPAKGTLPGQMHVDGFEGERLVNSFVGGDDSTGSLTSPPFLIERKFINVLVGGGGYEETAIELLVDGQKVRAASGPNTRSGGSERLDWKTWGVSEFRGKSATVRIVDSRKGGWGHINVDQIVQSDQRREAEPASHEIRIANRYLHLPVKNGAEKRRIRFVVDGKTVREFEIEAANADPDFFAFSDVGAFAREMLKVEIDRLPPDSKFLSSIVSADEVPSQESLYDEPLRPQFHFTSRRGWLNDPNGLVFYEGEWHLFYQHNPFGVQWGNMHWGHAVSPDLVHWQELPIALYPKEFGDWAFSGSAVVDEQNTSGFGDGKQPPLVLAYTSTGRGECIAYSNDKGRTWTEFEGNPVIRHRGRDPKLIPSPSGPGWNLVVYNEGDNRQSIDVYSSPDLKSWTFESRIDGFFECPDLFELKTKDGRERRWVLYAADGEYMLGDFDGKTFQPTSSGKHRLWYGNFYAAQSFDHAPDQRRIQIGWGRGVEFPGMPFNQQMTVPVELTLHSTADGPRMFAMPVAELSRLRGERKAWSEVRVSAGSEEPLDGLSGETFDIEAVLAVGDEGQAGLSIHGIPVTYDANAGTLRCRDVSAPVKAINGEVKLRILVDRGSIEIFANGGAAALSVAAVASKKDRGISLVSTKSTATFRSLVVHEVRSAWSK